MLYVAFVANAHASSAPSGSKQSFGNSAVGKIDSMEAEIADHVWSLEEVIALLN